MTLSSIFLSICLNSSRTASVLRRPRANSFAVNTLIVDPLLKYTIDSFALSFISLISFLKAGDIFISSFFIFSDMISLLCPRVAEPSTIFEPGFTIALQQAYRAIIKDFAAARHATIQTSCETPIRYKMSCWYKCNLIPK